MKNVDIEIENKNDIFKLRVNGILMHENKILCVEMMRSGFFCLPGGHIEIVEDSKRALVIEHHFKWIDINKLDNEKFQPVELKDKIKKQDFTSEHIIIK